MVQNTPQLTSKTLLEARPASTASSIPASVQNVNPVTNQNGDGTAPIYVEEGGPGAAMRRFGEQVPSQNVANTSPFLSPELQTAAHESTPTHEQITQQLANARAMSQMAMDENGNWVNLADIQADLEEKVSNGEVLSPDEVKV